MGIIRRKKHQPVQATKQHGWIWDGESWVPVGDMVPGWTQQEASYSTRLLRVNLAMKDSEPTPVA